MCVPMVGFNHSLVCFERSLQAKIQRQMGWGISLLIFIQIRVFFSLTFELDNLFEFFFLSFFLFFSFYYGLTVINSTTKIPFEQENRPRLRTFMFFLGLN